ncbi:hypothetical protein NW762_014251 [Fusarium torreyae]|uniref:Uncharacterized protein n=1 Tax=Fusarium torreyae TaxID=1237075 RepID=A0A9W8V7Z8_9HYPO|nr:hypothetical protein NW762_014251 [Fusarium torreyae]
MISQMAVSIALDLGLTRETKARSITYRKRGSEDAERKPPSTTRTREEMRTALALFHLTCSTWTAYRKTEPLRWTPYLNTCLERLLKTKNARTESDPKGTPPSQELDFVLAAQVKCQLMTLQVDVLTSAHLNWGEQPQPPSDLIIKVLLDDLAKFREEVPANFTKTRFVELYMSHTEMMIRKSVITKPDQKIDMAAEKVKNLQRLEQTLESAEEWLGLLFNMPDDEMLGINVDFCSHFMQTLVVLFRLNTHDEAGWSKEEIRKRADVIQIIDRCCIRINGLAAYVEVEESLGPYKGLLSFTTDLLKAIRTLFSREIKSQAVADREPEAFQVSDLEMTEQDINFSEEFLASVCEEPWFVDMFDAPWYDNSNGGPYYIYV